MREILKFLAGAAVVIFLLGMAFGLWLGVHAASVGAVLVPHG